MIFTGTKIKIFADNGFLIGTYPGFSGAPGYQSPGYEGVPNKGPIPQGNYYFYPREITKKWNGIFHSHPFWGPGWGNVRVPLHPYPTTITFGRGGFFLHDSRHNGTAGCIGSHEGVPILERRWHDRVIKVSVEYEW